MSGEGIKSKISGVGSLSLELVELECVGLLFGAGWSSNRGELALDSGGLVLLRSGVLGPGGCLSVGVTASAESLSLAQYFLMSEAPFRAFFFLDMLGGDENLSGVGICVLDLVERGVD